MGHPSMGNTCEVTKLIFWKLSKHEYLSILLVMQKIILRTYKILSFYTNRISQPFSLLKYGKTFKAFEHIFDLILCQLIHHFFFW